ncbi:MAG: MFS transporter [Desulfomonile sp.]|nr:MFS transporter [Desulfomonile sp.]
MAQPLITAQFLLVGAVNFTLFLIISTWNWLPVFVVRTGGDKSAAGLVMGAIGVTSLGSLPFLAPLIERYGRKVFIIGGIFVIGISNAGFLLFDHYAPTMIVLRLVQGVAFAACFNGCSTAVVDFVPADQRAQGIGLFGVSGSLAVAVGPYLGETVLLAWGFGAYFTLLVAFGLCGFSAGLFIREPTRRSASPGLHGFFSTAFHDGHIYMMVTAAVFGSGFAAMNTFFPLYAGSLGLRAGPFFVAYGVTLILVRIFLGGLADRVRRDRLIVICLGGFGCMLLGTAQIAAAWHTVALGLLFGALQGLSYPAMMAKMVDRSSDSNRAVVVALFTGSFGVGINASVLIWGYVADVKGIEFVYVVNGVALFLCALGGAFFSAAAGSVPDPGRIRR